MKKSYETPSIEVVKFQYRDQVVATSGIVPGTVCTQAWVGYDAPGIENCSYKTVQADSNL